MKYIGKYIDHTDHNYFYFQYILNNMTFKTVRARTASEARNILNSLARV